MNKQQQENAARIAAINAADKAAEAKLAASRKAQRGDTYLKTKVKRGA
jgi:hypothetical protein